MLKVSNVGYYDQLKVESEISKLIKENIKSERIMRFMGETEFQVKTKKKKNKTTPRYVIAYNHF